MTLSNHISTNQPAYFSRYLGRACLPQLTISSCQGDTFRTHGDFLGVQDGASDDHLPLVGHIAHCHLYLVGPPWVEFSWSQRDVRAEMHSKTLGF